MCALSAAYLAIGWFSMANFERLARKRYPLAHMTVARVFFLGGLFSYRALFNWISPLLYVTTMLGSPLFQILFFAYLGRYAGVEDDAFFVVGNAVQVSAMAGIYGMTMTIANRRQFGTLSWRRPRAGSRSSSAAGPGRPERARRLGLRLRRRPAARLLALGRAASGPRGGRRRDRELVHGARHAARLDRAAGTGRLLRVEPRPDAPRLRRQHQRRRAASVAGGDRPCRPLTHGIEAARDVAGGATLGEVSDLVWTEAVIGATYAAVAFVLFRVFEAEGRRRASPRRTGSRRYSGSTRSLTRTAPAGRRRRRPRSRAHRLRFWPRYSRIARGVEVALAGFGSFAVIAHRAIVSIGRTTASRPVHAADPLVLLVRTAPRDADQHAEAARVDGPVVLAPPFEPPTRPRRRARPTVLAVHTRARLVCPGETQRPAGDAEIASLQVRARGARSRTPEEARRHGLAELDLAVDDLAPREDRAPFTLESVGLDRQQLAHLERADAVAGRVDEVEAPVRHRFGRGGPSRRA